jgi:hypothetical protein
MFLMNRNGTHLINVSEIASIRAGSTEKKRPCVARLRDGETAEELSTCDIYHIHKLMTPIIPAQPGFEHLIFWRTDADGEGEYEVLCRDRRCAAQSARRAPLPSRTYNHSVKVEADNFMSDVARRMSDAELANMLARGK